ncbi:MAG: helix-turn-helix domain-containing protein [Methylotenera sp.]|nr:helix-turn-helix domain-containing protein [Oligoflexia bacterium]
MKIIHQPEIDSVSIDFKDGIEAKSYLENGVIVRLDAKGNVIGLDITDSSQFFSSNDEIDLKEACALLGVSESTLRRRIREGKIKYRKPNGKDYRFKRKDIIRSA